MIDPSPRERRDERGFTLIELMVAVAIIAILAAIVVPLFTGEAKKVKTRSEATAVFAEFSAKEERYKGENNVYLAVAACPAAPAAAKQSIAACKVAADWTALGIVPTEETLACSYEVIVGTSADDPSTMVPAGATNFTVPAGCCATGWYMIHAACDADGDGTLSHFMTASFDAALNVTSEGE